MRKPAMIAIGVLALALGRAVQAEAPQTLQQRFDAGIGAAARGECATAEPILAGLATDPAVQPGSLPAAMVGVWRGQCAITTAQAEQAAAWIRASLPALEKGGPDVADDAARGWLALGRLAQRQYDHDGALADYRHAAALGTGLTRIDAQLAIAMVTLFDGDGVALAALDAALAALPGEKLTDAARRKSEGYIRAVRIRTLMNLGRYQEAYKEAEHAITLAGGLTLRIGLADASLRADAAQAALLDGRRDRARELLAYTGAGRATDSPFAIAQSLDLPECSSALGLRSEDGAVVEFQIGDQGQVTDAQTVFTRGNYQIARIFAQAVHRWQWSPESLARIPPFYRQLVRVEVHCTTGSGWTPGIDTALWSRIAQWALPAGGLPAADTITPLARATALRRLAAMREAAGDRPGAGLALLLALDSVPGPAQAALAEADRALALTRDAEPAQRASAAAAHALLHWRLLNRMGKVEVNAGSTLFDAADDPVIAVDALAQNVVRLEAVTEQRRNRHDPRQVAMLRAIADDRRLDDASPLRQLALLRLASRAAAEGRRDEALHLFERTGLTEQQCALLGDIPRLKISNYDYGYPADALSMGFEGWVHMEYNIDAAGRTVAPRVLIAYPPFVFVDGALDMARGFRYDPTYRPSGKLACSAKTESIRFQIPQNH